MTLKGQTMSENSKTIDGVTVTEDGDVTHFVPAEEKPSFWQRLKSWLKGAEPYVKGRNLSDPLDKDEGKDVDYPSKPAVEVGVKVSF